MLDEAFTLKRYGVSPALALSSFVARRASLVDIGLLFCGQHSGLAVFSVNSHIISFACNNMNPFRAEGLREAQYNCRCDALVGRKSLRGARCNDQPRQAKHRNRSRLTWPQRFMYLHHLSHGEVGYRLNFFANDRYCT